MTTKTIDYLLNNLKSVLEARDFPSFDDSYLKFEIAQAIGEINRCRNFKPSDTKLYDAKYEYLIIPMCISSIAKIGAEGQSRHTENGVDRQYTSGIDYPKELIQQIVPLIK